MLNMLNINDSLILGSVSAVDSNSFHPTTSSIFLAATSTPESTSLVNDSDIIIDSTVPAVSQSIIYPNPCVQRSDPIAELSKFIIYGILLNTVALLGLVGNVISMIILSRPQMRSSINYLLMGLAICDTLLILSSILLFGIPGLYPYTGLFFTYEFYVRPHLTVFLYPLISNAQTMSTYLTLLVTLERFVAVCHPLRARSLCTYGRARFYVIVIAIFSVLYNLPRFWEAGTRTEVDVTHNNVTVYCVAATKLRKNMLYIRLYTHWLYMIFLYVIPLSCLAILNTAIYRKF